MTTHRIDLRPDLRPGGKNHGPTPMVYLDRVIGSSHQPEYAAARFLLENTKALPEDTLETYRASADGRGEMLCMSGIIGKLAKLTVVENDDGNPTFVLRAYKPFSPWNIRSPAAQTPSDSGIAAGKRAAERDKNGNPPSYDDKDPDGPHDDDEGDDAPNRPPKDKKSKKKAKPVDSGDDRDEPKSVRAMAAAIIAQARKRAGLKQRPRTRRLGSMKAIAQSLRPRSPPDIRSVTRRT